MTNPIPTELEEILDDMVAKLAKEIRKIYTGGKPKADEAIIEAANKIATLYATKIEEARIDELNKLNKSEIANKSLRQMQIRIRGRLQALKSNSTNKETQHESQR